jgi:hypothetical protein
MTEYSKHFDIDFQRGLVGEDAHNDFLNALEGQHEVKTDYRTAETGNIYIETWQYNETGKWPSGINVTTAKYWVTASPLGQGAIYVPTDLIRTILTNENCREVHQPVHNNQTNASIGRLIPLTTLLRYMGLSQ